MANLFPPSQLPQFKGRGHPEPSQEQQPPVTRARRLGVFLAFVVLGLLLAAVGVRVTGRVQWVSALPVAAAIGWYVAANLSRRRVASTEVKSEEGPVVW